MPLAFTNKTGWTTRELWACSGKYVTQPFSQELKATMSQQDQAQILNKLGWLGTHYKQPEENIHNNTDSDTSSGSDTNDDEEQKSNENEGKDEEQNETAETADEELESEPRTRAKEKCNEKKRYNTARNKHKSRIEVLDEKTKWLQEYKSNDEIANWPGYTIPYLPQTCKTAVVSAFKTILDQLPRRDQNDPASFSKQQWEDSVSNAPRLSAAGGDGLRPDQLHAIIKYYPDIAQAMYGYHAFLAHGITGDCTGQFREHSPHDGWAKTLLMLPRWLFHAVPGNKTKKGAERVKINSKKIRERVDDFHKGRWQELDDECIRSVSQTNPGIVTNGSGNKKTRRKNSENLEKESEKFQKIEEEQRNNRVIKLVREGEISKASRTLKEPCHVITESLCRQIDHTGALWKGVMRKVQGLHPKRPKQYDKTSHQDLNGNRPFGCGGM